MPVFFSVISSHGFVLLGQLPALHRQAKSALSMPSSPLSSPGLVRDVLFSLSILAGLQPPSEHPGVRTSPRMHQNEATMPAVRALPISGYKHILIPIAGLAMQYRERMYKYVHQCTNMYIRYLDSCKTLEINFAMWRHCTASGDQPAHPDITNPHKRVTRRIYKEQYIPQPIEGGTRAC